MLFDHTNTTLKQLDDHFDRVAYVEQLTACASVRTSAEELQSIYNHYFSPESHTNSSSHQGLDDTALCEIMQYKLCRGKWRPGLQQLVASNTDEACQKVVLEAVADIGRTKTLKPSLSLEQRIKLLVQLKGVGPATASLILTVFDEEIPFFSDELAAFFFPKMSKLKYTLKEYLALVKEVQQWLDAQQADCHLSCTAKKLEEMVWYWAKTGDRSPSTDNPSKAVKAKSSGADEVESSSKKRNTPKSDGEEPKRKSARTKK